MRFFLTHFPHAIRNLLRQRGRTGMAFAAIVFSVVAIILSGGFIEWVLDVMRLLTIRTHYGHIQVTHQGYRDNGTANPFAYLLAEKSPALAFVERLPEVEVVAPRLHFAGLVSRGETTVSFLGEGVDPEREARLGISLIFLDGKGGPLAAGDPKGIIIGQGLAANLGADLNDTLVLLANTPSGGINAVEVHVRGIFLTVNKAYDDSALRLPLSTANRLLRVAGAHVWMVLLHETGGTAKTLDKLRAQQGTEFLEFTPWTELAEDYNKTAALFGQQLNIMRLIIATVIVLSITNSLMMNVMERTGEIGTSLALGITRRTILKYFLMEGAVLGLIGGIAGMLTGVVLAKIISAIGIPMPPPPGVGTAYVARLLVTPGLVINAVLLALATTLVASLYPAWKASRMVIVDALRYNRA